MLFSPHAVLLLAIYALDQRLEVGSLMVCDLGLGVPDALSKG